MIRESQINKVYLSIVKKCQAINGFWEDFDLLSSKRWDAGCGIIIHADFVPGLPDGGRKSYRRPFLIFRAIVPVNYVVQRSAKAQQSVVHVESHKKCFGPTPNSWLIDQPDRSGLN